MTAGEGGLVITRDAKLARRMTLFHDKAWGYGDENPDHYFLALNYRMSELQGAVALAQWRKVREVVRDRQRSAAHFLSLISDLRGVQPQSVPPNGESVFWKVALRIDETQSGGDVGQIARFLKERFGVFSSPRYVQKPAFMCEVFREQRTFGDSRFPFVGAHLDREYQAPQLEDFPETANALAHLLVLPWNENYSDEHVQFLSDALHQTISHFQNAV